MDTSQTGQESKVVFDPLLRILHGWNALAIVGLIVTAWLADFFEHGADEATVWLAHTYIGYALICGLVGRLVWGLIGPRYARFADFLHLDQWRETWRTWRWPKPIRYGHDPLASLAFIALYALLAVQSGLGLALAAIEQNIGPLAPVLGDATAWKDFFQEPHEAIYSAVLVFIAVHLSMMVWHRLKGKPIAQAMVSGIQHLDHGGK
jgi:cytochrome b